MPNQHQRPWTDEEVAILRACYANDNPDARYRNAKERLPNRTGLAIGYKAWALSLSHRGATPVAESERPAPPKRSTFWTGANLERLRKEYEAGGMAAARAAFPDKSIKALKNILLKHQIRRRLFATREREILDASLGATLVVVTQPVVTPPRTPAPVPIPIKARKVHGGACDRGDREHIRKRLEYVVAVLSSELRRTTDSIRNEIRDLAKDGFRPDALARMNYPNDDALAAIAGNGHARYIE